MTESRQDCYGDDVICIDIHLQFGIDVKLPSSPLLAYCYFFFTFLIFVFLSPNRVGNKINSMPVLWHSSTQPTVYICYGYYSKSSSISTLFNVQERADSLEEFFPESSYWDSGALGLCLAIFFTHIIMHCNLFLVTF